MASGEKDENAGGVAGRAATVTPGAMKPKKEADDNAGAASPGASQDEAQAEQRSKQLMTDRG